MRKASRQSSFQLMGNFPRRVYLETEVEDLESLGFCPNALLHIQGVAPK